MQYKDLKLKKYECSGGMNKVRQHTTEIEIEQSLQASVSVIFQAMTVKFSHNKADIMYYINQLKTHFWKFWRLWSILGGTIPLKWTKTRLCRPSGYGDYLLFVLYNRVMSYRSVNRAQIRLEEYIFDNLSPSGLGCYWLQPTHPTSLLCLLHGRE